MPYGVTDPTFTVFRGTTVGLKAGREPPPTSVATTAKANNSETVT
jgi:hypothetical protein